MTKYFLFLVCYFSFNLTYSQSFTITKNTKISILTVDVANESHTLYGHTAIRIKDSIANYDHVFNYGMFDFNTKNFILKFVKGDLQYFAASYPYADFEYSYQQENRTIYEQILTISDQEKKTLFNKLTTSIISEDRFYTYKFIDRNCTTKVIDIVNSSLENSPIKNTLHKDKSYREVLFPYSINHYYMQLGINIIFGSRVDNQAATLFLPLDLLKVLKETKYKNSLLATPVKTISQSFGPEKEFSFLNSIYSLISVLILFILFNKKISTVIYLTILGLVGLFFSTIGFYSFHSEVLWNYNVLLFNPLNLILCYFIFKDNIKRIKQLSTICILLIVVYVFYMINKIHLWSVLPIITTSIILLIRLRFKKPIVLDKTI